MEGSTATCWRSAAVPSALGVSRNTLPAPPRIVSAFPPAELILLQPLSSDSKSPLVSSESPALGGGVSIGSSGGNSGGNSGGSSGGSSGGVAIGGSGSGESGGEAARAS